MAFAHDYNSTSVINEKQSTVTVSLIMLKPQAQSGNVTLL